MNRTVRFAASVLALSLLLPACGDDPTEIEDHPEAEGFLIERDGVEIFRYMLSDATPATLTLDVGVHDVGFVMLDENENPVPHPEGEEEEEDLTITFTNPSLITWTPEAHVEGEPETVLEFHGELNAMAAGSTTMTVCLLHEGHCDFQSVPIPVTIQ